MSGGGFHIAQHGARHGGILHLHIESGLPGECALDDGAAVERVGELLKRYFHLVGFGGVDDVQVDVHPVVGFVRGVHLLHFGDDGEFHNGGSDAGLVVECAANIACVADVDIGEIDAVALGGFGYAGDCEFAVNRHDKRQVLHGHHFGGVPEGRERGVVGFGADGAVGRYLIGEYCGKHQQRQHHDGHQGPALDFVPEPDNAACRFGQVAGQVSRQFCLSHKDDTLVVHSLV